MSKELYKLSYALKKEMQRKVFSVVCTILAVVVALNFICFFVCFSVRQTSSSMDNDIEKKSCILFSPLINRYERGDVVLVSPWSDEQVSFLEKAIDSVVSFFTAHQISYLNRNNLMGKSTQIRRVIGLPGDTIFMRDCVLFIKEAGSEFSNTEFELVKKHYKSNILTFPADWDGSLGVISSFDEFTLGKDEYFVLADSRNSSVDSRFYGPIKKSNIKACAIFQYFPLNKVRIFL